ncbi:MAG: hypothetical protein IPN44_11485 [Flavobacteriales bacterium]|nr:hypothetical protein [Flavobacteriales bacterium]
MAERVHGFASSRASEAAIYEAFDFGPSKRFDLREAQKEVAQLRQPKKFIRPILHRPFDQRYVFFHPSLVWSMSRPMADQMEGEGHLALVATRQVTRPQFEHAFVSRNMIEIKACSHDRNTQIFPLFLHARSGGLALSGGASANISPSSLAQFAVSLNLTSKTQQRDVLKPVSIFNYAYAVLYSPAYRLRYFEFLQKRVPQNSLPRE